MAISVATAKSRGWRRDRHLARIVATAASAVYRRFPDLRRGDLAMTLVVPGRAGAAGASLRGDRPIYPASVVKLFFMVAVQAWLEAGRLPPTAELRSALAAMIGQSSNDATAHIVDLLTGTTGGPALPPSALKAWLARRRSINRYFASCGWPELAGINLTQKTWYEAPYGRERQGRFAVRKNGNRLSTDAVARLMLAIERGEAVSRRRSADMMKLLARPIPAKADAKAPFDQVFGFLGEGLPSGSQLWSKAGWMSMVKHDAAIIRLPDGGKFVLVVFTRGRAAAQSRRILPFIARRVAAALSA